MIALRPLSRATRRLVFQFGLILLLGLALRVLLVAQMGNRYYFADTKEYEKAAQSLLAGHGPGRAFPRAPVYPAFMAIGFLLFGSSYLGVRLLQLVVGLGIIGMAAWLARRVGNVQHGLITALAAAVAPTLVFTSGMLYPTVLYGALFLALTLVARELDVKPTITGGALLGVLGALSFMTEQISAAPIAVTLLWLVWGLRRNGVRLAAALATAVVVGTLIAVPVVRYYEQTYGRAPIFMEKAQTVLWFARRDPDLAAGRMVRDTTTRYVALSTRQFVRREWGLLKTQTLPYLMDYTSEFVHFFKPMPDRIQTRNLYTSSVFKVAAGAYFIPVLLLGTIGLFASRARPRDRILLAIGPLATAGVYSLFFTQVRYRIPIEPQLLILATLGATRLLPALSSALFGEPPEAGPEWSAAARPAAAHAPAALAGAEAEAMAVEQEARP